MRFDLARHSPALDRQRQRFGSWWEGRSGREQMLLSILFAMAFLWGLMALVIQPIWSARTQTLADIRTYQALTLRLRQAGTLGAKPVPQRSGSPATILSASAAEVGLAPVVTPEGDHFRVALSDAPYDVVLRWVADIERSSNLRFTGMRLERRPASGMVSARFEVRG